MAKQSAIFRLKGAATSTIMGQNVAAAAGTGGTDEMLDDTSTISSSNMNGSEDVTAQLGISVEPIEAVQQKLMTLPAHLSSLTSSANIQSASNSTLVLARGNAGLGAGQPSNSVATLTLARKIIQNAFNYLGSFSSGLPGHEMVPMREFQSWWTKFERRLASDASFLERDGDA